MQTNIKAYHGNRLCKAGNKVYNRLEGNCSNAIAGNGLYVNVMLWPACLSPNFRPFRSTISHFQDLAHFTIFPLTPMLKFQSAIFFFLIWQIANIYHNLLFPHEYLIYYKIWPACLPSAGQPSCLPRAGKPASLLALSW